MVPMDADATARIAAFHQTYSRVLRDAEPVDVGSAAGEQWEFPALATTSAGAAWGRSGARTTP